MTFSIIGIDKKNKEIGIACFSKAFAIGGIVPAVKLNAGAVATQSYCNIDYKDKALILLKNLSPEKTIARLIEKDKGREIRQVIVMNSTGKSAGFTGNKNIEWAGHLIGKNFICAGNMLVGNKVLASMKKTFEESKGKLADKLIRALIAGKKTGGDKRKILFGSSSLIIEKKNHGPLGIGNRYIDLRVDNSKDAINDLLKLLDIRKKLERFYQK